MPFTAVIKNRLPVVVWPALALCISAILWTVTLSRAHTEMARAERAGLKEAASYAEAYEQYMTRSVGQMDQVTMQLKQSWEQSGNGFRLEDLKRDGMFTDAAFVAVSVADRNGVIRTSTRPLAGVAPVNHTAYFNFHKNNNSTALRIGVPPGEPAALQHVLQFTRRLDGSDDEFAGVVVLTVSADYFTSFYSMKTLGADGLVAMVGLDSDVHLEKTAEGAGTGDPLLDILPDLGQQEGARLLDGKGGFGGADTASRAGVAGKGGFGDGKARVLGWRRSAAYPLAALVGLSHQALVANADGYWRDSRNTSALATLCLFLLALLATVWQRRAAARLHEEDEVRRAYRTATEGANDGFYMAYAVRDRTGFIVDFTIVDCNERGAFFYGMSRDALLGARLSSVDRGMFGADLLDTYRAAMESGFHEDDRRMPEHNRLNIAWGHRRLVRVGNGLAVTLQDISERKAHESQLERMANSDALTGLPNRYWLINTMPTALARAKAADAGLALLFIDLDEFKHVNDTQGHAIGDKLLQCAAGRLTSLLRPDDRVVRFGGDEFIVVLDPCEGERQIADVAERVLQAFSMPFSINDDIQAVGASIGISMFPRDGDDAAALIKHADIAMYSGKSEGKGQYRFFHPSLYKSLTTRAHFKHSLREAIERDQLVLYFQPRVDTRTGELCSMEALVRWIHPKLGLIPPLEFIPQAEANGLILGIGEVVMAKACAQLAAWRAAGLPLVPVSINVSPKQFAQGNIHRQLALQLERHQIPPHLLEVEITESAMMGEQADIIAELSAIRALGVKLHVDDFGTGYSSLSQLQKLKMDVLKVDKAFTSELANSKEGKVFFQAIVSMAHALGMSVVAEGVETEAQLLILQELACNEVQGYFIARPMPAADIEPLMLKRLLFPGPPRLTVAAQQG
jgi:diguanylate cyclase (GGDEF)-like protein